MNEIIAMAFSKETWDEEFQYEALVLGVVRGIESGKWIRTCF